MSRSSRDFTRIARFEGILLASLLAIGLLIVPVAAYYVGISFFQSYDGGEGSLGDYLSRFYSDLFALRHGLWFVVLAPWLTIQALRLAALALRRSRARPAVAKPSAES